MASGSSDPFGPQDEDSALARDAVGRELRGGEALASERRHRIVP